MPDLLDHRLLFVTGKGGVGKSTLATAIGMAAARRGLRTIIAELSSQRRVARPFAGESARAGHADVFEEVELVPGLFAISIDPQHAMEEYLRVKAGTLGSALGSSRLFGVFAMATPGMRELLSIGKVWELAQLRRRTRDAAPYDLVVVDAPASGHGVGILRTPLTFAEIARVGPIASQAQAIAATLADPRLTAIVAVCTPEEMPVNETLEMTEQLHADGLGLDLVVANAVYPDRFDAGEAEQLALAGGDLVSAPARGAVRAALSEHARARVQREQLDRLHAELPAPVIELPYLFCDELGRGELEDLADALEAGLDVGQEAA